MHFKLVSEYQPKGDQPAAIDALVKGLNDGAKDQVLLGITGSGKTFTIASVIQRTQRSTLVLAHNKTLAAQLFQEFRTLFPENKVEYFVSYYDYYQPEAYVPAADVYIEKEAIVNEEIDRLRMSATRALFERRDVIVVASVSCIYGLGDPDAYYGLLFFVEPGARMSRDVLLQRLVELQYERSDINFQRGHVSRAWRRRRDLSELPGSRVSHRVVGRRDRLALDDRSAARRSHRETHVARSDLSEDALCDVATHDQTGNQDDSRRARVVGAEVDRGRETGRGAAAAPAHDV